jgi:hypothetical protein
MTQKDNEFIKAYLEFKQKLIDHANSFLLPAFQGLTFSTPSCDGDEDETYISGKIFEKDGVCYDYSIWFYPNENQSRVDITRTQHGNQTRIGANDTWAIHGTNLTAEDIANKKHKIDSQIK